MSHDAIVPAQAGTVVGRVGSVPGTEDGEGRAGRVGLAYPVGGAMTRTTADSSVLAATAELRRSMTVLLPGDPP